MSNTNEPCPTTTSPILGTIHKHEEGNHFTPSDCYPQTPAVSRSSTVHASDEDSENVFNGRQKSHKHKGHSTPSTAASKGEVPLFARTTLWLSTVRWRGVMAMLAGVFAQMLSWGLIMTYGTILAFYVRYLTPGVSITLISLAGAVPGFLLLALALLWGRLLDAGHQRVLNIVAGVFLTSGMVALAFTGDDDYNSGRYWAILLASIPMGIGQSIYFIGSSHMAKTWHPKHKGLAMGVTNSGAAIGGVAWPLVFDKLVESHGFREGVACLAGISGALAIFIAIFGTPAPGFQRNAIGNAYKLRTWWPTRAFRSKVFIIHVFSLSFVYLGILAVPFFVEIWARRDAPISVSEEVKTGTGVDLDSSDELGVFLVVTLNACQLPGRLLGSTMCDKFRARKVHAIACFIAVIIVGSCWFTVSTFSGGLVFVALFGLSLGVMVSLPMNDMQDLLGNDRTYLLGQYAGAVFTCCCPFIIGGAVIAGALVQCFDVWISPGAWTIGCFFLAGCGFVLGVCIKDDTACFEDANTDDEERQCASAYGGSTRINSIINHADLEQVNNEKIAPGNVCKAREEHRPRLPRMEL